MPGSVIVRDPMPSRRLRRSADQAPEREPGHSRPPLRTRPVSERFLGDACYAVRESPPWQETAVRRSFRSPPDIRSTATAVAAADHPVARGAVGPEWCRGRSWPVAGEHSCICGYMWPWRDGRSVLEIRSSRAPPVACTASRTGTTPGARRLRGGRRPARDRVA